MLVSVDMVNKIPAIVTLGIKFNGVKVSVQAISLKLGRSSMLWITNVLALRILGHKY